MPGSYGGEKAELGTTVLQSCRRSQVGHLSTVSVLHRTSKVSSLCEHAVELVQHVAHNSMSLTKQ